MGRSRRGRRKPRAAGVALRSRRGTAKMSPRESPDLIISDPRLLFNQGNMVIVAYQFQLSLIIPTLSLVERVSGVCPFHSR